MQHVTLSCPPTIHAYVSLTSPRPIHPYVTINYRSPQDPSALRRAREWPGPATYAVDHRPTEPTPHAHTMPRASRNLDTSSERVIKDGDYLEIDAATARDAVGPRHAAHYNMSQALVRPEPGNVTGSPAVWVPPSADVGDAVRWRGPRVRGVEWWERGGEMAVAVAVVGCSKGSDRQGCPCANT